MAFSRENLFSDLFPILVIFLFYWPEWRCMGRECALGLLLMRPACPPSTPLPMIPTRLSGRALDRLSDEMMALLWEVIPKWAVSDKDCTFSHSHAVLLHHTANCTDDDWFVWDGSQEAPIDFCVCVCVLSKIFIYSCIYWAHARPPFPKGGWYKKDNTPYSTTRQMTCNIISEMSQ